MKIAVITTLGDNLIKAKMIPLSRVELVEEIYFVTDGGGPPINKVRYITPPRWLYLLSLHRSPAKLLLLMFVAIRYRPSIVMAYNVLPHGYSAWVVARMFGKKVFQHLIGGISDVVTQPATSDNRLIKYLPIVSRWITMLNIWVIRHSDLVFVPGRVTQKSIIEEFGVSSSNVVVLHSTIDTERFRPSEAEKPYDVIAVAALSRRKRVDNFVRSIALVKKSLPQVQAAIMGEGPAKDNLLELCRVLGLTNNIRFLGYQRDMENYYTRARMFVLTSAFEGLSCAAMEAMASGLPVVVPNVGDMSEIAIDGETGYLVMEPNNPEEYAHKIIQLLQQGELLNHCSRNSSMLIREKHSFHSAQAAWQSILFTASN